MKKGIFITLSLFSMMGDAADIAAGRIKAGVCAGCHGDKGISSSPLYPNLAGQKAAYSLKQLQAFKDGRRESPSMAIFAKQLSDEDMKNIAAYYESLLTVHEEK